MSRVTEKLSWLKKNKKNNATIDAAFSIFLGLLMCSTLFQQSSVRLTRAFPIGSQSYSSIKAINVAKNQWLKRATKHIPPCVTGADTAARLTLSLQPNIPFVSESCRGEHKNKKCLDGETQCMCVRVCVCVWSLQLHGTILNQIWLMIWKVSALAVTTQFRTKVTSIMNTPLQAHSYVYIHVTNLRLSLV